MTPVVEYPRGQRNTVLSFSINGASKLAGGEPRFV